LANEVVVFDASTNRITDRIEVEGAPDQVSIGSGFAYVRATAKAEVSLIAIESLGRGGQPFVKTIPAGDNAPLADASLPASAPVIVPTPDRGAMLIANPTDRTIFFYSEGMNVPMGSFPNMRRELRAALAVDRRLREREPGVYTSHLQLPAGGDYDVAFHMSSPPVSVCFTVSAEQDPALTARSAKPYRLEFLSEDREFAAGEKVRVQFRLVNPATSQPIADLTDFEVQLFRVPGTWRVLHSAKSLGDGLYEVGIELPRAGVYYLHVASRSLNARYNDLPSLVLQARESRAPDTKG
jgi:hypothetical protein